jgi:hypothetical protein
MCIVAFNDLSIKEIDIKNIKKNKYVDYILFIL